MVIGVWLFARYWKRAVQKILWRLRNRLIVAYLLIALVPIVLITTLIGLGAYMVIGQMSIHLLTNKLDRSTGMLRSELRLLAAAGPAAAIELRRRIPEQIEQEFPGLQVVDADSTGRRVWPMNSTLEPPPAWLARHRRHDPDRRRAAWLGSRRREWPQRHRHFSADARLSRRHRSQPG